MKNIVFLVSGNGGNFSFLDRFIKSSSNKYLKISSVIADRSCGALQYAKRVGLENFLIKHDKDNESELERLLSKLNPDIIITNIHKVISPSIVKKYGGKLINLHYSLLPAFKSTIGINSVKEALTNKCRFIGSTVHYVNDQIDSGEIISQCVFPVKENWELNKIMEIVFRSGCFILLNSIFIVSDTIPNKENPLVSSLDFKGADVLFSPALSLDIELFTEQFWEDVREPLLMTGTTQQSQ